MKDITLLKSQAERCSNILLSLSKNPQSLQNNFFKKIKIEDLIKLSFEKFNTNKVLSIKFENTNKDISILYKDEINYAFNNIIQNAIQHSINEVNVAITRDSKYLSIMITDDGPGFSRDIFNKIGEPYIKSLTPKNNTKSGLGLGIFIGKTLLEKNRAKLLFRNSETRGGAEIKIEWLNKNLIDI